VQYLAFVRVVVTVSGHFVVWGVALPSTIRNSVLTYKYEGQTVRQHREYSGPVNCKFNAFSFCGILIIPVVIIGISIG
jgi:hypothetical protein